MLPSSLYLSTSRERVSWLWRRLAIRLKQPWWKLWCYCWCYKAFYCWVVVVEMMMLAMLLTATQSIRVTADGSWRLVGISTFTTFTTFTSCPAAPPHSLLFALLSSFQYKHQHQHQPIPSISPHWLLHFCILAVVYYLSVFVLKPKNFPIFATRQTILFLSPCLLFLFTLVNISMSQIFSENL